jgi:hypothetical protein
MNDAYDAIDYLSAALDQNKKERMIDELLDGMGSPMEGDWRLCHRTGTLEVYNKGQWIVA